MKTSLSLFYMNGRKGGLQHDVMSCIQFPHMAYRNYHCDFKGMETEK